MTALIMRYKSDTFSTLFHFFAYVSTQFGCIIQSVQCDNGCEFDNSSCTFFLSWHLAPDVMILHLSLYGKAECMVRTTNSHALHNVPGFHPHLLLGEEPPCRHLPPEPPIH
jgi:cellulose synthase/poly-beta-1,6-N-acetylglucosamine synthase-like glycosyltransferase